MTEGLSIGWAELFLTSLPEDHNGDDELYCSEYVSRVLRIGGLDPNLERDDLETTPTQISESRFVEILGTAKIEPGSRKR